jgi:hypothetical protein
MAIFDTLVPLLRARFPNRNIKIESGRPPRGIIPAAHPEVGDVELHDDGHEITAYIGHFTHSHFANYDDIPTAEKEKLISENVGYFLDQLFADRIVMWGSHQGGGGYRTVEFGFRHRTTRTRETICLVRTTKHLARR